MKIFFITSGDISIVATMKRATGMAEYLIALNNEVSIIALDCDANRKRFQYECPNANILYFNDGNSVYEQKQKKRLIEKGGPDLVYVSSVGFRNWIHKFNGSHSNTKYVVEHSELTSMISHFSIFRRGAYLLLEYLCQFIYDGQIVSSKYLYNHFTKKITSKNKEKVLYNPYGFNKNIFEVDNDKYYPLQKKNQGYKVVLYMGTLRENYGFLDLINAGEILNQQDQKFKILIIGNGAHKQIGVELVQKKKLNDIIEFVGFVEEEDLGVYFKLADVFISPLNDTIQDWARCPSKLFMYSAFSKPVVTCRIGEALELFHNGNYFYESGNVQDMADKIYKGITTKEDFLKDNSISQEWEVRSKDLYNWAIDTII
jgi:glycosyltransferase involved in cell wall biosynthesis